MIASRKSRARRQLTQDWIRKLCQTFMELNNELSHKKTRLKLNLGLGLDFWGSVSLHLYFGRSFVIFVSSGTLASDGIGFRWNWEIIITPSCCPARCTVLLMWTFLNSRSERNRLLGLFWQHRSVSFFRFLLRRSNLSAKPGANPSKESPL